MVHLSMFIELSTPRSRGWEGSNRMDGFITESTNRFRLRTLFERWTRLGKKENAGTSDSVRSVVISLFLSCLAISNADSRVLLFFGQCSAATLRRASRVARISFVEVEYSPWVTVMERNGVLDVCKELGITVLAYSPLGHGQFVFPPRRVPLLVILILPAMYSSTTGFLTGERLFSNCAKKVAQRTKIHP